MKALASALRVFSAFSSNRGRWSVSELCQATGFSKSQVSKVLGEFRAAGLLRQDPGSREYSVGLRAVALSANYLNSEPLVHEAIGPMRRLANDTGHTSVLGVRDGAQIIYLLGLEGPHFLDVKARVGTWLPFHATAIGKVMTAFQHGDGPIRLPEQELRRFTKNTITDRRELAAQLAKVRRQGVAATNGETADGLAAQAVPIYGAGGVVVAALGLVYPIHVVTSKKRQSYTHTLHTAARQISSRLDAPVYPFGRSR
jgi:DNA-binding IclR family transcriptional regulator